MRVVLERAPLPVLVVAVDGGRRVPRLGHVFRNASGIRYRARVLCLLPAPRGKGEILAVVQRAEREIRAQVDAWAAEETRRTPAGAGAPGAQVPDMEWAS